MRDLLRAWAAGLAAHLLSLVVLGTLTQGLLASPSRWPLLTAPLLGGVAAALAHPAPEREIVHRHAAATLAPAAFLGIADAVLARRAAGPAGVLAPLQTIAVGVVLAAAGAAIVWAVRRWLR